MRTQATSRKAQTSSDDRPWGIVLFVTTLLAFAWTVFGWLSAGADRESFPLLVAGVGSVLLSIALITRREKARALLSFFSMLAMGLSLALAFLT